MRRLLPRSAALSVFLFVFLLSSFRLFAADQYQVHGMIVSVDRSAKTFTASIEAIPHYMQAMTMPFEVRTAADLDGLTPGSIVTFTLVVDKHTSFVHTIHVVKYESVEQDPFTANRLTLLNDIVRGASATQVAVGEAVPDFSLTDQKQKAIKLSDFSGKIVAVNFIYTSCPLPNFCLRLANNFNVLQRRFQRELGRDLVLLTVTFDPTHDTPAVLEKYASTWSADPAKWHFLTGTPADVTRVCEMFGVQAYANEGLLDHSLHTVLIDRKMKLAANIEGNQFTAAELGDLTQSLLR